MIQEESPLITKKKNGLTKKNKRQLSQLEKMNTIEEEKIEKMKQHVKMDVERVSQQDGEQEIEQEYNIKDLSGSLHNSDELIEVLTKMIVQKKINSKNSFDVPMLGINIEDQERDKNDFEVWKKISLIFGIDKEIYHHRTEHLHNQLYQVISKLKKERQNFAKADKSTEDDSKMAMEVENENGQIQLKRQDKIGRQTLDTKRQSINIDWRGSKKHALISSVGEIKFNNLEQTKSTQKSFSDYFHINERLELELESKLQQSQFKFNSKNDINYMKKDISIPIKIQMIDDLNKIRKKVIKFGKKMGKQIFDAPAFNFNLTLQDTETLLGNLPILNYNQNHESQNMNIQNYQTNMLNNELDEIKQHLEKKKKPLNFVKLQQKESLLGAGVEVFKDDAGMWMSQTDLRFTNTYLEKQKMQIVKKNPDDVHFNETLEDDDCLELIKHDGDFDIIQYFNDYHLMPMSNYGKDFLNLLSLRPLINFSQQEFGQEVQYSQQNQMQQEQMLECMQELKQKQRAKVYLTITEIQNGIYPIIVEEPAPKSMRNCYDRLKSMSQKFRDLEFKVYFCALCHLASSKGIQLQPVQNKDQLPSDYNLIIRV